MSTYLKLSATNFYDAHFFKNELSPNSSQYITGNISLQFRSHSEPQKGPFTAITAVAHDSKYSSNMLLVKKGKVVCIQQIYK